MPVQTRTRRTPLLVPALTATLVLSLVLVGCGDDPETLSHVTVSAEATDAETSQSTTVHGYVTDIALPPGTTLAEPLDDPVLVAVDVTVEIGPGTSFSVRPADFQLRTSSGETTTALTTVNRALEDESLWPLLEVGASGSLRGWLAFAVERGSVDGATTLVAHRPEALTTEGRGTLDPASVDLALDAAG